MVLDEFLFQNIEPFALEILINSDGETKNNLKTTLTLKGLQWDRDIRLVKMEKQDTQKYMETDNSDLEIDETLDPPEPPGHCPGFTFMPVKVQLMKMILKASYYKMEDGMNSQTQ